MNEVPAADPGGLGPAVLRVPVWRVRPGRNGAPESGKGWPAGESLDEVAVEAPLTLRVEGRGVAVVMRTPGHDRELAAGFLLTEGVIRSRAEVFEISVCPSLANQADQADQAGPTDKSNGGGDSLEVLLADPGSFDPEKLTRHVFTSSSCGVCSRTSLTLSIPPERVLRPGGGPVIAAEELADLPEQMRERQRAFAATGGLHACAWWEAGPREWKPGFLFEDVGRHNALDKLLGHALLTAALPLGPGVLMLSGRISFELVQKAHAAEIPVIAAVGAPSSLAVAYAEAAGITLCGFVRAERFTLYSHPERVR